VASPLAWFGGLLSCSRYCRWRMLTSLLLLPFLSSLAPLLLLGPTLAAGAVYGLVTARALPTLLARPAATL
jgi:hypothetical protein